MEATVAVADADADADNAKEEGSAVVVVVVVVAAERASPTAAKACRRRGHESPSSQMLVWGTSQMLLWAQVKYEYKSEANVRVSACQI